MTIEMAAFPKAGFFYSFIIIGTDNDWDIGRGVGRYYVAIINLGLVFDIISGVRVIYLRNRSRRSANAVVHRYGYTLIDFFLICA